MHVRNRVITSRTSALENLQEETCIWQGHALPLGPCPAQEAGDGGGDAKIQGRDVKAAVVHCVEHRQPRAHLAARAVEVHLHTGLVVLEAQREEHGYHLQKKDCTVTLTPQANKILQPYAFLGLPLQEAPLGTHCSGVHGAARDKPGSRTRHQDPAQCT